MDIIMEMQEIVTRILTAIHCRTNLLKLLLRSQLIRMSTAPFTTICSARRETGITFAANHLFAVVFRRKCLERRLDNSTTKTIISIYKLRGNTGGQGGG
jgi:hypothetical protein